MKHLTVNEVAGRLGITPGAVRVALNQGRMKGVKFGRDWAVSLAEVERYARYDRKSGPKPKAQ